MRVVGFDEPQVGRNLVPPFKDPLNENLNPLLIRETDIIGSFMALKLQEKGKKGVPRSQAQADPVFRALEEELREVLGTKVLLRRSRKGKGVIEIPFLGVEDFERIFALIAGREASEVVE